MIIRRLEIGRTGIWPEGFYLSSGKRTSSGQISTKEGILGGVIVRTDGTNDVTITLHDNASSALGTVLLDILIPGADKIGGALFGQIPVLAEQGIFLTLSGTGGSVIVYYR